MAHCTSELSFLIYKTEEKRAPLVSRYVTFLGFSAPLAAEGTGWIALLV